MKTFLSITAILLWVLPLYAQIPNGPGGVEYTATTSNLKMWWRADAGITLTGGVVSAWADQTANGNNLVQPTPVRRPSVATSAALNNQQIVRYGGSHYFSSGFSGPNVNDMTLFLVANGTTYQSLFRFQNTPGTYVVYPWEFGGAPRTFISSSDGGTGSGIASGLVTSANNVGAARYKRNTATTGMQTWLNGGVNAQRTSANAILPSQPFFSGIYNPGTSEFPTCDVGELICFYTALNDAQMVIVQNYLAAKFNVTLSSNDVYTMDNAANGNFDYDVAGIGRVNASNIHSDARGTSIVRMNTPSALSDNSYLLWGHDGATLLTTTTNIPPAPVVQRFTRIWRPSVTGTVGTVTVSFDLTGLGPVVASDLRLLIDKNNNGLFSDETTATGGVISGASLISGSEYGFTGVTLNNGERFTLATINNVATPLPIELENFTAACNADHIVQLDWATASEINNAYFTVEKSVDGINWQVVKEIQGEGTSNMPKNYTTTDAYDLSASEYYYRLVQTDVDGKVSISVVLAVGCEAQTELIVFPNPSTGIFEITSNQPIDAGSYRVYNSLGELIHVPVVNQNEKTALVNLKGMLPGIYFITCQHTGEFISRRIVLE